MQLRIPFPPRVALVAGAIVLLAAACGSGSDAGEAEVASLDRPVADASTTTVAEQDPQDAVLALTACLREQGLDVDDPTFDANGNPTGGFIGPGSEIDPGSEEFQAAMQACGDLLEGVAFGPGGGRIEIDGVQTALSDFTACLRDEGVDVEDIEFGPPPGGPDGGDGDQVIVAGSVPEGSAPDGGFVGSPPDGGGPGGAGFDPTAMLVEQLGLDGDDPAVQAAMDTCQPILESAFQPPTSTTEP